MLGHANLETTEIYTHVSIDKLIAVHKATHPSRLGRHRGVSGPVSGPSLDEVARNAAAGLLDALAHDEDDTGAVAADAPQAGRR
jgi:integrase/recombinase XerD